VLLHWGLEEEDAEFENLQQQGRELILVDVGRYEELTIPGDWQRGPFHVLAFDREILNEWNAICSRVPTAAREAYERISLSPSVPIEIARQFPMRPASAYPNIWRYEMTPHESIGYRVADHDYVVIFDGSQA